MSMHEIDELFKRSTRLKDVSNSSENRYYFLYNYDATVEESPENHFPGTPVGVAFLPGWTWHINEMARQNLRPNYFQGHVSNEYDCMTPFPANKQQLFTVPREKQGVYGFVYKISHEDDEKIHRVSSKSKIKMMQCVTILAPHSVYHNVMINVSTYLDPRHTSDALRTTGLMEGSLKGPDQTMKCMWAKAFATMRNYGVPFWYIQSIRNKIMGFLTDPEPISIAPADLLIDTAAAAEEAERASRLERYLLEEVIPEEEDYVVDTPTRCRNYATYGGGKQLGSSAQFSGSQRSLSKQLVNGGRCHPKNPRPRPNVATQEPSAAAPTVKYVKKRASDEDAEEPQPKRQRQLPPSGLRNVTNA